MHASSMSFRCPLILLPLVGCLLAVLGPATGPPPAEARELASSALPLRFEENRGQTGTQARFLARGPGFTLFLTDDGPVLSTVRMQDEKTERAEVRIHLEGSAPRPAIRPEGEPAGVSHYFLGGDARRWRRNVPACERVRYEAVYPGIDVLYYGREGQLEYDFLLAPGADPARIRLSFEGAGRVELAQNGDLLLHTPAGALRQHRPVAYQEIRGRRVPVDAGYRLIRQASSVRRQASGVKRQPTDVSHDASRFTLHASPATPTHPHTHTPIQVALNVGAYDPAHPLVIDPIVTYATLIGGGRADGANGIAVDRDGNAYVTGFTTSSDFPTTAGAFDRTRNDANVDYFDAFVTKLAPDGRTAVYSTYLGGSERDSGIGIAVDGDGSAYVTGSTRSTDFPTTSGAFDRTNNTTNGKAFAAKLSPDGDSLVYSTYLGAATAAGGDTAGGIAVDDQGSAFLTGTTIVDDEGNADVYIRRLRSDGSDLLFNRTVGGSGPDGGMRITLDSSRNAYVTGFTRSDDFPVTDLAFQTTFGGGDLDPGTGLPPPDALLLKVDADGSDLEYATYLGGAGADSGNAVAVDNGGRAVVTGATASPLFPTTLGAFDRVLNGAEAFVAQFNFGGTGIVYSTFLGGSADDAGTGVALDGFGNAYVTGWTRSRNFPVTTDAFQPLRTDLGGALDAFLVGLTPGGTALIFGSYLGGDGDDIAYDLARHSSGDLYAAGISAALRFPTTPLAFQIAGSGGGNAFAARVTGGVPPLPPAAPSNLTAELASATSALLEWTDNANNEDGFEIVRFLNTDTDWSFRARLGAGTTSFTDTGLEARRLYTYIVRSFRDGVASPWSAPASVRTEAGPPEAPEDLEVIALSESLVRLRWSDVSTGEDGFRVERRTGSTGDFQTIATLGANVRTYDDRLVLPRQTYTYRVIAFNDSGDSDPSNTVTVTIPAPPTPTPPTVLTAEAISAGQIDLTWQDNSLNETGFEIQRRVTGEAFRVIATTGPNDESFSDTTVEAGMTYTYRVRATGEGGFSLFTNTAVAQTPGGDLPPARLRVTPVSDTALRLDWEDNPGDATSIRIERSTDGGRTYTQIDTAGGDVTTYTDTGLTPATRYFYRVRAVTPRGTTGYSNAASGVTLAGPLDPPRNLTAAPLTGRSIRLSWEDRSGNETGFRIERRFPGGTYQEIATAARNATTFTDTGLNPSTAYQYRVAAVRNAAVSAFSNEARATTLPELSSLTVRPGRIRGGRPVTGTVQLTGPAPAGGLQVGLSSTKRWARPPAAVTVPAGRTIASFSIATRRTNRNRRLRIVARAGGVTKSARLAVRRR